MHLIDVWEISECRWNKNHCTHVHTYTCTHAHMHMYTPTRIHTYAQMHTHAYMYTCTHVQHTCTHAHIQVGDWIQANSEAVKTVRVIYHQTRV